MQDDEIAFLNIDESELKEIITRIMEALQVSEKQILASILQKKLDAEFYEQVGNIYSDDNGEIGLIIKDKALDINIQENKIVDIKNWLNLRTEAIYIDDPFVIDELRPFPTFNFLLRLEYLHSDQDHRMHLKERLSFSMKEPNIVEEIVVNDKFETIYNKIASVCDGEIVRHQRTPFGYKKANSDKILDVRNLSTGLKTFVILKKLLANGTIQPNGTIILDEPEIHLHPEWQLLFAELIVLLYKQFGMHVLLNTHSPYFLRAIQVYAAKYEVADKCKYYLAELIDGESAYISDVSDNVEKIYDKLSKPLQRLENMRWLND